MPHTTHCVTGRLYLTAMRRKHSFYSKRAQTLDYYCVTFTCIGDCPRMVARWLGGQKCDKRMVAGVTWDRALYNYYFHKLYGGYPYTCTHTWQMSWIGVHRNARSSGPQFMTYGSYYSHCSTLLVGYISAYKIFGGKATTTMYTMCTWASCYRQLPQLIIEKP